RLLPEFRSRRDVVPQDVARRDVGHAKVRREFRGLGSLAGSGWAEEDEPHEDGGERNARSKRLWSDVRIQSGLFPPRWLGRTTAALGRHIDLTQLVVDCRGKFPEPGEPLVHVGDPVETLQRLLEFAAIREILRLFEQRLG